MSTDHKPYSPQTLQLLSRIIAAQLNTPYSGSTFLMRIGEPTSVDAALEVILYNTQKLAETVRAYTNKHREQEELFNAAQRDIAGLRRLLGVESLATKLDKLLER
jgi:hypothetical protein